MKLGEALTKYRGYRAELIDQQKTLSAQLKNAQDKAKMTGDTVWADEAATLQLSLVPMRNMEKAILRCIIIFLY